MAEKKITTGTKKSPNPVKKTIIPAKSKIADSFPIVGIGASAGGLEALELFLKNVPEQSNMAFVVIQHLDPTHKGIMVELLQRNTKMKVMQTRDRTRVKPNCVYVIPPNKDMSILRGVLHLLDPVARRGLRLPIDFFFRSLADDQQEKSIGVILSGMGSDGTLGLRAIKEKAGIVFVQDPSTAKFDSMPRSAIDASLADVVAPVEELPEKIHSFNLSIPRFSKTGFIQEDKTQNSLEKILILLRSHTGHDFTYYKSSTIYRRIERRMGIHQIEKIPGYVRLLQENPGELELLFKELLIGVTSFFRDAKMWDSFKEKAISSILAGINHQTNLRAWVPGCATGEEAYSLAIIFKELIEELKPAKSITLNIFATDLDRDSIEKARLGIYSHNISADVSPERLKRYFIKKDYGYEVSKSIREMVIFAPQNIIMDPPFTKLDILCCRNLLIYLTSEIQKKIIPLFHYTLNPEGVLFLGSAETIGSFSSLFKVIDNKSRIYRHLKTTYRDEPVEFPSVYTTVPSLRNYQPKPVIPVANIKTFADEVLLQKFSPAAVLVNDKGDIIYINGKTGKYLEPAAGKANWNIFAMAREGLQYELTQSFKKAIKKNEAVTVKNVMVGTNGGAQVVDVSVQPLKEPASLRGMLMIVFKDVDPIEAIITEGSEKRKTNNKRVIELEREFEQARLEIQTVTEEMQSSQEELKSANEELQSANEELQSTNEELTTSKEEMQSMNEELTTVNNELQSKVDELSRINDDMKNLLDSTDIATLFLDEQLRVKRFTSCTTNITKLIASDIGRPITDIASDLFYSGMENDVNEVLRTLVRVEREIFTEDEKWHMARILPYRTSENVIDGVVITYTDITLSKKLEEELRKVQLKLEMRIDKQKVELNKSESDLRNEKRKRKN
ncbi:MAG: PAS domain-containing protein [Bacteroidetes bacterium]|nr:PAS domain-containing protein [Bacteroidota bacterium]